MKWKKDYRPYLSTVTAPQTLPLLYFYFFRYVLLCNIFNRCCIDNCRPCMHAIMFITHIADAISIPVSGAIIQKTQMRWGQLQIMAHYLYLW